jgi:uncharacterized protein YjiS (DUF1127 family)
MIDWDKAYPVVSITRQTLKDAGLTDEQITLFSDEKMGELAQTVFIEGMHFLDNVQIAAEDILGISWYRQYPALTITREKLKDAGISVAEIEALTHEDMLRIASKVTDCFREELDKCIFMSARHILDFGDIGGRA